MSLYNRKLRILLIVFLLLIAAAVRAVDVWRPIDGTSKDVWREPDVGGIARNFYREGMNILYPRIDWRGDGPGFVESEFPLYPWTVALMYHLFGYHEEIARMISYVLSLGAWFVFFKLASLLLPSAGVIAAVAFFTFSPIAIRMAAAVQPEPLMFLSYLMAAYYFIRWYQSDRVAYFIASFVATVVTILAKLPAIHIGFLFAGMVFEKFGWRFIIQKKVLAFAIGVLFISLLWYSHARSLWIQYGNSLGMSNEAFIRISSLNFLVTLFSTIRGNIKAELVSVWTPAGALLGAAALFWSNKHSSYRIIVYWLCALAIFYLVTGRTTGESWARHYHIVSIPSAALLIGLAMANVAEMKVEKRIWQGGRGLLFGLGALLLVSVLTRFPDLSQANLWKSYTFAMVVKFLGVICLVTGLLMLIPGIVLFNENVSGGGKSFFRISLNCVIPVFFVFCMATALLFELWQGIRSAYSYSQGDPLYSCARKFKDSVPEGSLIVASGAPEMDLQGIHRAYNAPYMFFWMDRKGFSINDEEQSISKIEELRKRGAKYFVAEKIRVQAKPGFEEDLTKRFRIIEKCPEALLFELTTR